MTIIIVKWITIKCVIKQFFTWLIMCVILFIIIQSLVPSILLFTYRKSVLNSLQVCRFTVFWFLSAVSAIIIAMNENYTPHLRHIFTKRPMGIVIQQIHIRFRMRIFRIRIVPPVLIVQAFLQEISGYAMNSLKKYQKKFGNRYTNISCEILCNTRKSSILTKEKNTDCLSFRFSFHLYIYVIK